MILNITNFQELYRKLTFRNIYERVRYRKVIVLTYKRTVGGKEYTNSNIEIKVVTNNNVNDALIYEPPLKVQAFKRFLDKGDCGFYAYSNGRFIHRSWVTFGPKKEPQWNRYAPIELNEGDAYIHWCETVPWARGMGVYPDVLNHILDVLSDQANEFYISTTSDNVASRNGIKKAGFCFVTGCEVTTFCGLNIEKHLGKEKLIECGEYQ